MSFHCGDKAEAVDEVGVWRCCVVVDVKEQIKVSYDGWSSEWDRWVCLRDIREQNPNKKRSRPSKTTIKNPDAKKTLRDDILWLEDGQEVIVDEVDPINFAIKVTIAGEKEGEKIWLPLDELFIHRPSTLPPRKRSKQQAAEKQKSVQESEPIFAGTEHEKANQELFDFEYSVYVDPNGTLIKVGSLYVVDSCSFPVLVSRIVKCKESHNMLISGFRCLCDGVKVVSVCKDFVVTVGSPFVIRLCTSSEYNVSSVSREIASVVFECQARVCKCQENNFGNVIYQRELRRHALGAQMRQAVFSGISLNATRPGQPVSLGAFDAFQDMGMFGLSVDNNFKAVFTLQGGFDLLDKVNGKGWDVKPLRFDVSDCHFKFVHTATLYLDRKNFVLKLSFSYSEAPFPLCENYREKCRNLLN